MINKGLTLRGAQMHGQRYSPMLLERMTAGHMETAFLATHTASPDRAPTAYDMFKHQEGRLCPSRPSPRAPGAA